MTAHEVWLVCHTDYDTHEIMGAFSSEELACEYRDELNQHSVDGKIIVERYDIDAPRRELPGAWDVEIALDSESVIRREWWHLRPDALLQIQTDSNGKQYTRRATGLTLQEAISKARTLIANSAARSVTGNTETPARLSDQGSGETP